jgi:hypothetical protein
LDIPAVEAQLSDVSRARTRLSVRFTQSATSRNSVKRKFIPKGIPPLRSAKNRRIQRYKYRLLGLEQGDEVPSGAPIAHQAVFFPATLGARERLLTYAVGYGVGLGMPLLMGVGFAAAFSDAWPLFLPVPFFAIFGAAYLLRPIAFTVSETAIGVVRPLGTFEIPLRGLSSVRPNIRPSSVGGIGLARVGGFYGTFGVFWNRRWGRFRVYITNSANTVELAFADRGRVFVSPDDKLGFAEAVSRAARLADASVKGMDT